MSPLPRKHKLLPVAFLALVSASAAADVKTDPPAKVTIASDGRLLVNGTPTFFIGFAPGPPIDLRTPEGGDGWAEMAAGGMSVVRSVVSSDQWTAEAIDSLDRYLKVAHEHGVRVWPFLRNLVEVRTPGDRERLARFVTRFRDSPAVLFWKSADEPEWGKKPVGPLKAGYDLIRELDLNHPVWFCHAPRGTLDTLRPYNAACDVLSTDVYPVSDPPGKHSLEANKGLSMVGDYTKRTVELAAGRKMVFMVLQVGWSGINPAHNPKNKRMFPTAREERYMLYQAIICGADSVSFFGMPVALTGRDAELGWNWTYWRTVLKPLLAEIKPGSELYPALTAPDSKHPVSFSGAPQIEARFKEVGPDLYILAAAREGEKQTVRFSGLPDGNVTVVYENRTLPVKDGSFSDVFAPHDVHVYRISRGSRAPATAPAQLRTDTFFDAGEFTPLFDRLQATVRKDRRRRVAKDKVIYTNPYWFRDHVHEMKAYKLWEDDLSSFADALIERQHPDGFFHEIMAGPRHNLDHAAFVTDKHLLRESDDLVWIRLELEADIEYLMVEAAYTLWQASGDDAAMRTRLPHLVKAIEYDFTDPTRWDSAHGALKRTFTIDTWDFTYGVSDHNRRIEPGLPMGIMHGDNSGLYQACRQLAIMLRAADQPAEAAQWDQRAAELRERINRLCFNGRFYTHQVLLQPVQTGVNEAEILSLSNTYDINRGLPTHDMAVRIIDEYAARRKARAATHFAEWFSIDPPYPEFFRYKAGQYINGGLASFVAGELAKAAFNHGREAYGADLLHRVAAKVAQDGAIYFLYTPDGKNQGGGPSGWGAAAVISAMVEGLAGVHDDSILFREVTVSPRFLIAGLDKAAICTRYGPSGAYVSMEYEHRPADRTIHLRIAADKTEKAHLRVLLPATARDGRVVEPADLTSHVETIEASHYVVADWSLPLGTMGEQFVIQY